MDPRLATSKKWTSIPQDYLKQIQKVFSQTFAEAAKAGSFRAEGRIYKEEILLRVGYLEKGQLRQINAEVSMQYTKGKDDVVKLIYLGIDVAATLLDEYFSNPDFTEFPTLWQPFEAEGRTVHVQFSGVNSDLEGEADRLLGIQSGELVEGADLGEDEAEVEAIKGMLGIDSDDDDQGGKTSH